MIANKIKLQSTGKVIERIGIIGLGYVGLNLALFLCEKGLDVVGIDVDKKLVENFRSGRSSIKEIGLPQKLRKFVNGKNLEATTETSRIKTVDVILVTVGTPLDDDYSPNYDAIRAASNSIASNLRGGHLVIIKSTITPGTTEQVIKPILEEKSGLKAGESFVLAFCPERLAEGGSMKDFKGSALENLKEIPIIVSGTNPRDREIVSEFWEKLGLRTIPVSGFKEAELAKLADNLWIDLNIALANEIARLSEKLGVDALEVIEAANTLPKGEHMVNILYPGAGVGGSCLPKDPWFVYNLGKKLGLNLETPRVSREVNDSMTEHVCNIALETLKDLGKTPEASTISILGLAFKNSTSDMRNTPAKRIAEKLVNKVGELRAFDPWVDREEAERLLPPDLKQEESLEAALRGADCIILVTAHPEFKEISFEEIRGVVSQKCGFVDGRAAVNRSEAEQAGFLYKRIGLGR